MGKAARRDAINRWQWKDKIKQYASVIMGVYYNRDFESNPPKVSVIITSYNLEKFLSDAIGSVIKQTIDDFELIIVDDCSTDNTQEILKHFHNSKNVRFVQPPQNLGLSGARNYGFKYARGKYIIYLDADDMLAPNALGLLTL